MDIQHCLDQIEAAITDWQDEHLRVSHLASQMAISRWQLQRVFFALTGYSVSHYVRLRRLSLAAERLIRSDDRIIDIALDAGFDSQAAFNRAFTRHFKVSPGRYRSRQVITGLLSPALVYQRFPVQANANNHNQEVQIMNVRIEQKPSLDLYGVEGTFRGMDHEQPNNHQVIPDLWQQLLKIKQGETGKACYGAIRINEEASHEYQYLAAYDFADTSPPSNQLTRWEIPAQRYAVFEHRGKLAHLGDTFAQFFGHWLPDSDFKIAGKAELECYDHRFDPESDQSVFEYWVPVEPN